MQNATDGLVLDRLRGMLIGLAVGDALGAAVEFMPPGSFEPVTGYRAGGPHGLAAGEWTDDTSMALALANSLNSCRSAAGFPLMDNLDDQARNYVAWMETGKYSVNGRCFDIGNQTRAALLRFKESGDARTCGDYSAKAAGNGSIMRLAPVPIAFACRRTKDLEGAGAFSQLSSIVTHPTTECQLACRWFGITLAALALGSPREEALGFGWGKYEKLGTLHAALNEVVVGQSYRRRQPPEIEGSGWVVKSLEAALWAFHDAPDFRTAVLRAVNLGDDADTTGAVCGQLAGAYFGESGIPVEWREGLAHRDMIEAALDGLLAA